MRKRNFQHGFTLLELSIVLIIIALIISGILIGQELIHAAELRATISQLDKYNSATNTFHDKYGGLPGDLDYTTACSLGFLCFSNPNSPAYTAANAGNIGLGDNNGLIDNENGHSSMLRLGTGKIGLVPRDSQDVGGEMYVFWRHLSDANMIDGNFGSDLGTDIQFHQPSPFANVGFYFPPAKLGQNMYFVVFNDGVYNYFGLGAISAITTSGGSDPNPWDTPGPNNYPDEAGLAPIDAYNIDTKLDDGMPSTGKVFAINPNWVTGGVGNYPSTANTPTVGFCTVGSVGNITNTYNISTGSTTPACDMAFRFN